MKTSQIIDSDLSGSVLSVPPLAWNDDFTPNHEANTALIRHIEAGGVTTLLYGGNANMHNVGLTGLADLLQHLIVAAGFDSWVLPSVGPDFGSMMDQAPVLKELHFPTVMILPIQFPATAKGIETGIRRFADKLGKPIIIYIKTDNYLSVDQLKALKEDGVLRAIKYAVPREDPNVDAYLSDLCEAIGPANIVSGFGERPAIDHLRTFNLAGFTSGSVCIAPSLSMQLLRAIQAGDFEEAARIHSLIMPMEDERERISPIRVLHDAVTLAGIASMGPMYPMLSGIEESDYEAVGKAASELLKLEMAERASVV
jgi:dihydrodipicolinate synthase/N-acetylneuraminate lyase